MRENNNIRGIRVRNVEYKLSCFADDTLCFLDGSINSCRALFNDLGVFAKYSGLKPNIDKTEAFWAGARVEGRSPMCEDMHFRWVKKLKVLGIYFANDENEVFKDNFEKKLQGPVSPSEYIQFRLHIYALFEYYAIFGCTKLRTCISMPFKSIAA